jgi:hypothetical protein
MTTSGWPPAGAALLAGGIVEQVASGQYQGRRGGRYRHSDVDYPPISTATSRGWQAQARDSRGKVVATAQASSEQEAVAQVMEASGQTLEQHGYGQPDPAGGADPFA